MTDEKEKREQLSKEIQQLLEEMSARKETGVRTKLRMAVWKSTIHFSYGVKRLLDIVLSLIALISEYRSVPFSIRASVAFSRKSLFFRRISLALSI